MGIFAEDETVRPEELCELTEEGDIALKDKNCIGRLRQIEDLVIPDIANNIQ